MNAPRINGVADEPPPFAGDLPDTLGPLAPYADSRVGDAGLPVVSPGPPLPRLRPRIDALPLLTLGVLGVSVATLALALVLTFRGAKSSPPTSVTPEPPAIIAASGRDGHDRLHCMWDIVTVTVSRAPSFSGDVMTASVDAPNGTLRLVLRQANGGFRGYLYSDSGVLRTEPHETGLAIWPDEHVALRVDGLPDAIELGVGGRQTRMGSRGEGPCA
ncbi:MAG: hypothetical protein KGK07_16700 [Chloroflexota bacterium]|nr:hypothetical protein [Chloroflexota bacterium]